MIGRARLTGILPIDIQAVELVGLNVPGHACDEYIARRLSERHIREVAGPLPATDRYQHCKRGVPLLQCGQCSEVFVVMLEAIDDAAVLDIGEGIVDPGELSCSYFVPLHFAVL